MTRDHEPCERCRRVFDPRDLAIPEKEMIFIGDGMPNLDKKSKLCTTCIDEDEVEDQNGGYRRSNYIDEAFEEKLDREVANIKAAGDLLFQAIGIGLALTYLVTGTSFLLSMAVGWSTGCLVGKLASWFIYERGGGVR